LGEVFSLFDKICEKYNVYKVKTIGGIFEQTQKQTNMN